MTRLRPFVACVAAIVAAAVLHPATGHAAPPSDTPGGAIEGTLTTAKGAPVAGVRLQVRSQTGKNDVLLPRAVTDAAGRYALTPLPPGRYRVGFLFPETMSTQWAPRAAQERRAAWFVVRSGETTVVDESLFPTGGLDVTLRGRDGNGPVAAFCADAIGDFYLRTGCTTTGTLHLAELPVGTYGLAVSVEGETGISPAMTQVTEDGTTTVEVQQR